MPNHVTNVISAHENVLSLLISTDEQGIEVVDFNNVCPMPEWVDEFPLPWHVERAAQYAVLRHPGPSDNPLEFNEADWELFLRYLHAARKCGHLNWYDWSIANWGTKWNAYRDKRLTPNSFKFETACSAPHPVMEKLAALAKDEFMHEWADEDTGSNVGFRLYGARGEVLQEKELSGTREGYELCFKLDESRRGDYELVGDNYQWVAESGEEF